MPDYCPTKPICETYNNSVKIIELIHNQKCDLKPIMDLLHEVITKIDHLQNCCDDMQKQFECCDDHKEHGNDKE